MRFPLPRRNWLNETRKREYDRRLNVLEIHIQDLEGRLDERFHTHIVEQHPDAPKLVPEESYSVAMPCLKHGKTGCAWCIPGPYVA